MELQRTVPWGRDFNEYLEMFSLSELTAKQTIIGCGDGPASFNREATARGISVTSVDPIYAFSKAELKQRIEEARSEVMPQIHASPDDYIWTTIKNPDELESRRMHAMRAFIDDYEDGSRAGRYVADSLPDITFKNNSFDYALCSHYLFLYSPQVDEKQHVKSVLELCRLAREVRIYPLVSIEDNKRSKHLPAVFSALDKAGYSYEEEAVSYEFQRGAKTMLKIKCDN